uniref:Uncharacterized protein n=1 Tax=Bionectria ochroleuca TaxID=29856 RepID=A0A8H7N1R4_BIOOC
MRSRCGWQRARPPNLASVLFLRHSNATEKSITTNYNGTISTNPSADLDNSRLPSRVVARQVVTTVTVVATNDDCVNCTHLSGGAIAGIVIGSIAGFLLLLWIIRSCFNLGAPPREREKAWYKWDEEPRHHHHHRHHHRSGSRRRGRSRSYRASSTYSVPAVVINERSRSSRRPRVYV